MVWHLLSISLFVAVIIMMLEFRAASSAIDGGAISDMFLFLPVLISFAFVPSGILGARAEFYRPGGEDAFVPAIPFAIIAALGPPVLLFIVQYNGWLKHI